MTAASKRRKSVHSYSRKMLLAAALAVTVLSVSGCYSESASDISGPQTAMALGKEALSSGNFYALSGDDFYQLPAGTVHFDIEKDYSKADPERVISFLTSVDDALIPTVHKDECVVFFTEEALPEDFTLERYKDNGYTFGIYGLKEHTAGVNVSISDGTYVKGSSFENTVSSQIQVKKDTNLLIGSIGSSQVTSDCLSECGSIMGLKRNGVYQTGIYVGTRYFGMNISADSHIFSSMEVFTVEEYKLSQNGYAILSLPDDLPNGYYYVSGKGMFRYIDSPESEGEENIDYNDPYFYEDEDGNVYTRSEWKEKANNQSIIPSDLQSTKEEK